MKQKLCMLSDTDPGAKKGFPVSETLQRSTLPGFVPFLCLSPSCTSELQRKWWLQEPKQLRNGLTWVRALNCSCPERLLEAAVMESTEKPCLQPLAAPLYPRSWVCPAIHLQTEMLTPLSLPALCLLPELGGQSKQ